MNNHSTRDRKIEVGIVLILLFLVGSLLSYLFYFYNDNITGEAISKSPIHEIFTKALCTSDNFCRDYVYTCENSNLISIVPTDAYVQHSSDWKDTRENSLKYKSCG